ncbi:MAG: response regulator [Planctomycetota bacterium]
MKRILFVDDETSVLDGLRRMLRNCRHAWDMSFVTSGREALQAMEERPFDVIVTDMKMPVMDGAELLTRVKELHPRTVRIVLSGHADLEASMRSIPVSHQFLTKPCQADTLREVVDRACNLESLLRDPAVQEVVGGVEELPVLPRVYRALAAALSEPEVDLAVVAGIVEGDVAITAKILQLVNSSFFGVRQEISSVHQATAYLGVNTIRDLVLSLEVFQHFRGAGIEQMLSIEGEQSHAMLTARIARRLLADPVAQDQAFLAGMLHDVGKLLLAAYLPDRLQAAIQAGAGSTRPFQVVEEDLFAVSHAEIGAYLLGLWGMPYPVVEAVAHHHHPSRVPEQTDFGVLGATHFANALARIDRKAPGPPSLVDLRLIRKLGLEDRIAGWREIAREEAATTAAPGKQTAA